MRQYFNIILAKKVYLALFSADVLGEVFKSYKPLCEYLHTVLPRKADILYYLYILLNHMEFNSWE